MEKNWVDFRVIKAAVTMQMIVDRYGVILKRGGDELRGKCPIHHGASNKEFTVNLSKNVFKCFSDACGAHGNVLDFVASIEKCSVREAAVKLSDWFKVGSRLRFQYQTINLLRGAASMRTKVASCTRSLELRLMWKIMRRG